MKNRKNRKKNLKYKFYLCIVFPIFIVVLAVKVLRTYLKLRVRQAAFAAEPVPVEKEPVRMESIVPEPVKTTCISEIIDKA